MNKHWDVNVGVVGGGTVIVHLWQLKNIKIYLSVSWILSMI